MLAMDRKSLEAINWWAATAICLAAFAHGLLSGLMSL